MAYRDGSTGVDNPPRRRHPECNLFSLIERLTTPPRFLRLSRGVVVLWIAILKFADPSPVVGMLQASFPALASSAFLYLLALLELGGAVLLLTGRALRYAGLSARLVCAWRHIRGESRLNLV